MAQYHVSVISRECDALVLLISQFLGGLLRWPWLDPVGGIVLSSYIIIVGALSGC